MMGCGQFEIVADTFVIDPACLRALNQRRPLRACGPNNAPNALGRMGRIFSTSFPRACVRARTALDVKKTRPKRPTGRMGRILFTYWVVGFGLIILLHRVLIQDSSCPGRLRFYSAKPTPRACATNGPRSVCLVPRMCANCPTTPLPFPQPSCAGAWTPVR